MSFCEEAVRPFASAGDRAQPGYCQHQKSWLIDAGTETGTMFLGGLNLNPNSVVAPGHGGEGQNHDVYVELAGLQQSTCITTLSSVGTKQASVIWLMVDGVLAVNATSRFRQEYPTEREAPSFKFNGQSLAAGIQMGMPRPRGVSFDIEAGELSNFDQYCSAIGAARRSIYIENQYVAVPEIIESLHQALLRGVEVVAVIPAAGEIPEALANLAAFHSFTLAGIAGLGEEHKRNSVWIHAKLMVVDGEWGTVGSCNLHRYSLFGNCEMNAAFWDQATARMLLTELLYEHLNRDISELDDRAALQLFSQIARNNRHLLKMETAGGRDLPLASFH